MTDIEEYFEEWSGGRGVATRFLGAMRDLRLGDVVLAQWGEASSPVHVVRADGSMVATGRQSADYSCSRWQAQDGEEADGVATVWWDDGEWCVDVESKDREVSVQPTAEANEAA